MLRLEKSPEGLLFTPPKIGSVAQWLEQGTHKPKVAGSNPA
jgi:hypothetical protein